MTMRGLAILRRFYDTRTGGAAYHATSAAPRDARSSRISAGCYLRSIEFLQQCLKPALARQQNRLRQVWPERGRPDRASNAEWHFQYGLASIPHFETLIAKCREALHIHNSP